MSEFRLQTPVVFIIFNRPDTSERVFAAIAKAKPPVLLVIADGPRTDRPGETERCATTRRILEGVDWPCKVMTCFSDVNLGCKDRISSGLNWAFTQVDEAIILEDDCLPEPSFFQYCETLLEHYRSDTRVAMISGDNLQFGQKRTDASYYFSRFNHIWGWATWKRAWQHYDLDAEVWPAIRDGGELDLLVPNLSERKFWHGVFQAVYERRIDTWDYQWILTSWSQRMMTILPSVNLVSNIGFGPGATHTQGDSPYSCLPVEPIAFPLVHPHLHIPNSAADAFTAKRMFSPPSLPAKIRNKFKAMSGRR